MILNKKRLLAGLAYQIAAILGIDSRQSARHFEAVYPYIMIKMLSKVKRCLPSPILNNYNSNILYYNTVKTMKNKMLSN
jgi:hypothetical protein